DRYGVVFWLTRGGDVLLRRQPESGLLGGMVLPPSTPWRAGPWEADGDAHAPADAAWETLPGAVRHVFTHFALHLTIRRAAAPDRFAPGADDIWADMAALDAVA